MPPNEKPEKSDARVLADAIGTAMKDAIKGARTDTTGLSPDAVRRLEELPEGKRWREIPSKSDETGATFIAVVVESKSMPLGRVIALKSYKHPPGVATYVDAGGLVPTGLQILRAGTAPPSDDGASLSKQDLTSHYMQWRWVEFWQKDLRRYVGREYRMILAIDSTLPPWKEGQVRADITEDAHEVA